jgi:hypothetical protein
VPAGEACLGLLAETLEQYRRNTNDFFRLYMHEPHRTNKEKDENLVGILSSTGPAPRARSREVAPRALLPSLRLL